MAGLTAARHLQQHGWNVTVLDKGRGVGGRLATRRIGAQRLDHGAQFFTVRDPEFAAAVQTWEDSGWVQPWFTQDNHTRYACPAGMNSLAQRLAEGLPVHTSCQVSRIETGFNITTQDDRRFTAHALILTPPAEQSLALLAGLNTPLRHALNTIEYDPCFALLLTGDGESRVPEPGYARPAEGPISWVADNARKGITTPLALTIHATPAFSRDYFDRAHEAEAILREAAGQWHTGNITEAQLHRWRYSQPVAAYPERCLFSHAPGPHAVAGDAFGGPRIEGAFLSGLAAARAMLQWKQ